MLNLPRGSEESEGGRENDSVSMYVNLIRSSALFDFTKQPQIPIYTF